MTVSKEDALRRLDQLEKNLLEKYQMEKARAEELRKDAEKLLVEKEKAYERIEEVQERIQRLENVFKEYEGFDRFLISRIENVVDERLKALPNIPAGVLGTSSVELEASEMRVKLSHTEEAVKMTTKTGLGKILYAVIHDLKGKPSSENEISDELQEHGWPMGHSTLAPNLAQLVKQGLVVKEEGKPLRYRPPGRLKIEVEKE